MLPQTGVRGKQINTTSKLGLPSITLLRNQHGQTRRKRHNKKRKQDTRDETDTTTIQSRMLPIQATVAYLRARSVRTLRDPANLRARSVRTWKKCTWSSSTITKASNSSGRVLVTLVLVNPKQVHLVAGSTIISSLWKRCVWSIEHNHYLPVKSSRVQPQLFSPSLYSLTFWLISDFSGTLSKFSKIFNLTGE